MHRFGHEVVVIGEVGERVRVNQERGFDLLRRRARQRPQFVRERRAERFRVGRVGDRVADQCAVEDASSSAPSSCERSC